MPANVTPEFAKAQRKYEDASTDQDKLIALQEMKSLAPRHKGGENLRKEINKKIAALRSTLERKKTQTTKKGSVPSINVKKEGIGQIAVIGVANSGKSWLINQLAGTKIEEGKYPFTTQKPEVGMMEYEGAKIQLVEVPAIIEGSSKGKFNGLQILSIIRNADAILICANNKEEEKIVEKELHEAKIYINRKKPKIEIAPSKFKGINISGKQYLNIPEEQIEGFLKSMGKPNSTIIINEEINNLEIIGEVLDEKIEYRNHTTINTKKININNEKEMKKIKNEIFEMLEKILVYTKKPGGEVEYKQPLALKIGSTIEDVAEHLHKDFLKNLKFVRVWGSTKFPGQRVQKEYELKNKDIIEINM